VTLIHGADVRPAPHADVRHDPATGWAWTVVDPSSGAVLAADDGYPTRALADRDARRAVWRAS
jgi:hypothetical protein